VVDLSKTMDAVAELHKSHGVRQKGNKLYTQVVHRMEAFRRMHGTDFGVNTEILVNDGKRVVIKAVITDKDSRIIGSGLAEEIRGQGVVNTTSALENAETSAIGRALASLGLAGGEYASANEMEAVDRKKKNLENPQDKEEKPGVGDNSYSSNNKEDHPPQPTWEQLKPKIEKNISQISNKMYQLEIRKESRLNDLRGEYAKMKKQYESQEFWQDIHAMFKKAQDNLSQ